MLAAVGAGWFSSLQECASHFVKPVKEYEPIKENTQKYETLFRIYKKIYSHTKTLSEELKDFRK
jgi:xylulokinase